MTADYNSPGVMVDPACPLDWAHPLNAGLVADWTIVPNSGWSGGLTLRDLARGGHYPNDGTLTNGPVWSGNKGRRAGLGDVVFDGSDDFVSVPSIAALQITGSYTLAAWCNPTDLSTAVQSGYRGIVAKEGGGAEPSKGYYIGHHGGNLYGGHNAGANELDVASVMVAGVWIHVAVVFDANAGLRLYANGRQIASNASTTALSSNSQVAMIGKTINNSNASLLFFGPIDSVQIYNRPLSSPSIAALYLETSKGNPERFQWQSSRTWSFPVSGVTPAHTQSAYRFRNDNGSETTATWQAAEDVNVSAALFVPLRLRVQVDTNFDAPTEQMALQFRRTGGTWQTVKKLDT